jgi:hypothetical protein
MHLIHVHAIWTWRQPSPGALGLTNIPDPHYFGLGGASQVQVPWVWQIYLTHITLDLAGRHIHALWTWLVPNLGVLDLANMSHPRYLGLANMPHPYFFGNGLHDFLRGGREGKTLGRSSSVGRLSTHASPLCLGWPNALKVAP